MLLAADLSNASLNLTQVVQYGILGVILVLILLGHLVPGNVHKQALEQITALQTRLERLQQIIEERVIPALVRSTDALAQRGRQRDHDDPTYGDTFR